MSVDLFHGGGKPMVGSLKDRFCVSSRGCIDGSFLYYLRESYDNLVRET